MARLWLTFGLLTSLLATVIVQRTSLAENLRPWFLATHPDSSQPTNQSPGGVSHGPGFSQTPGQGDQQTLQASRPPDFAHYASGILGDDLPDDAFVRRIVAVGDLHGDFGNAKKVLEMSGVIDTEGNWTGAVDFFVQTGDIIDR